MIETQRAFLLEGQCLIHQVKKAQKQNRQEGKRNKDQGAAFAADLNCSPFLVNGPHPRNNNLLNKFS